MIGHTTENYLREIYKLEMSSGVASTKNLSQGLEVSAASATDMLQKLAKSGLIRYERYYGAHLTSKGRRVALRVTRYHRLWEIFLVKHLGYSWDEVHGVADQLEHVSSENLDTRLEKYLGNPAVDPHGDPIPDSSGYLPKDSARLLSEINKKGMYVVKRVSDNHSEILKYVSKLGMKIGTKITIVDIINADRSLILKIGTKRQQLSKTLAENIYVEAIV